MFGWLLRLLLLLIVLYFILSKFEKMFRRIFGSSGSGEERNDRQRRNDLHIDYRSKNQGRQNQDYDGGEYVDYEEVDK